MNVPAIPMKSTNVMTTVSPIVWTARDGRIKPPMLLPSMIAFIMPEARAKKNVRYATAITHTSLELLLSIEVVIYPLKSRL